MAHELGHCFGLYHGGDVSPDPNYDGRDNSMDLMSIGAHFYVHRLRPANRARVRHHFRVLPGSVMELKDVVRNLEIHRHSPLR